MMNRIYQPSTLLLTTLSVLLSIFFALLRKSSIVLPLFGLFILFLIQYLFNFLPKTDISIPFPERNQRLAKLSLNVGRHNRHPGFILPAHETSETSILKCFSYSWICVILTSFFTTVTILMQHLPYTGWTVSSLRNFIPFFILIAILIFLDLCIIIIQQMYLHRRKK